MGKKALEVGGDGRSCDQQHSSSRGPHSRNSELIPPWQHGYCQLTNPCQRGDSRITVELLLERTHCVVYNVCLFLEVSAKYLLLAQVLGQPSVDRPLLFSTTVFTQSPRSDMHML